MRKREASTKNLRIDNSNETIMTICARNIRAMEYVASMTLAIDDIFRAIRSLSKKVALKKQMKKKKTEKIERGPTLLSESCRFYSIQRHTCGCSGSQNYNQYSNEVLHFFLAKNCIYFKTTEMDRTKRTLRNGCFYKK